MNSNLLVVVREPRSWLYPSLLLQRELSSSQKFSARTFCSCVVKCGWLACG